MDPADPNFFRSVLEQQDAVLGRHQTQLDSMTKTMESLAASVTDLAAQIQQLHLSQAATTPPSAPPAAPTPLPQPALHVVESRLPPPERYSGEPGSCRAFLTQCALIFQLQPLPRWLTSSHSCLVKLRSGERQFGKRRRHSAKTARLSWRR